MKHADVELRKSSFTSVCFISTSILLISTGEHSKISHRGEFMASKEFEFIVEVYSSPKRRRTTLKNQIVEYLVVSCRPFEMELHDEEIAVLKVFGEKLNKLKYLLSPGNTLRVRGT